MWARLSSTLMCGTGNRANDEEPNSNSSGSDVSTNSGNEQNLQPATLVLRHYYHQLHRAAIQENWKDTVAVFNKCHQHATEAKKCALHFAMRTGKANRYLKILLEHMEISEMKLEVNGKTPISIAAAVGNVEVVKLLVAKDPNLPHEWTTVEQWPLNIAARYGNVEMVSYLLNVTTIPLGSSYQDPCRGVFGNLLLENLINSSLYGAALRVVERYSNITRSTTTNQHMRSSLTLLANQPFAFRSTCSLSHFQRLLYYCVSAELENQIQNFEIFIKNLLFRNRPQRVHGNLWNQEIQAYMELPWNVIKKLVRWFLKEVEEIKLVHDQAKELVKSLCELLADENDNENENEVTAKFKEPFLMAAEHGIMEIVQQILDVCPSAIDLREGEDNIFVLALKNRIDDILCLEEYSSKFLEMAKNFADEDGNDILHLAGKLPPENKLNSIASPAFQLQSELNWFERVEEELVRDQTEDYPMNFQEQHEGLRVEGEKWMKNISTSCKNVALLITIIAFLSVTLSSLNKTYGYYHNILPEVGFTMVNGAGSISTIISWIAFLKFRANLKSSYDFYDFHLALPCRLLSGLRALCFSIFFMLIAFEATLYLVVGNAFNILIVLILVCIFAMSVCCCIAPFLNWYSCNLMNL